MWKRILAHGAAALATPGLRRYRLCMRALVFVAVVRRGLYDLAIPNGRFLVSTREFLDPAIYAPGRRLMVLGTVAGRSERRVGDLPYAYPMISAERIKLWPKETPWVSGEYPPLPLDSPVLPYTR
jgi:Outer membrane lipoprotein Slp family